jgi:hypothetical protein
METSSNLILSKHVLKTRKRQMIVLLQKELLKNIITSNVNKLRMHSDNNTSK